jgi:hypothetical protein
METMITSLSKDSMRNLIEQKVKEMFKHGFPVATDVLNFDRKRSGKPLLVEHLIEDEDGWRTRVNPNFDIEKFVTEVTDVELLFVFDNELCEKYR